MQTLVRSGDPEVAWLRADAGGCGRVLAINHSRHRRDRAGRRDRCRPSDLEGVRLESGRGAVDVAPVRLVLVFAVGVLVAGALLALVPAMLAARTRPAEALREA